MKITTYIVEMTNQKNEKYMYVGKNCLVASSTSSPRVN